MAMAPERSQNLHNFSLPSWSRTMQRSCIKIDENSDADTTDHLTSSLSHHLSRSAYHGFSGFVRGAVEIEKKRRSFCDGRPLLDSKRILAASSDYTRVTSSRPMIVICRDKLIAQFNYDGGIAEVSKELIKEYTREGVKIREVIISHEGSEEIEHFPELTTIGSPHQPKTMTTSTEVGAATTTTTDVDNKLWNLRTRVRSLMVTAAVPAVALSEVSASTVGMVTDTVFSIFTDVYHFIFIFTGLLLAIGFVLIPSH